MKVIGTGIAAPSGGTSYRGKLEHGVGGIGRMDDTMFLHEGVPIVRAVGFHIPIGRANSVAT